MKSKFQIIIFTGFIVLAASLFRFYSGPFYYGNNSDPSYLYLYNFLYVLEGKSPQFVDHPGTTLDILGALVVKVFVAPKPNTPWLLTNALRAEEALGLVWLFLILIYAATLMGLGFYILKKSRDRIFTGLVLLGSLWLIMIRSYYASGILPISANVNSDTMMMTADNLMLWAILRFYFSPQIKSYSQAISLGAAVAFALATKFTALPFIIVAFCILVTWQQRILLVTVALGGFVLLTAPIWGSYPHMISWIKGLIMVRNMQGIGAAGFDAKAYGQHFIEIIKYHWFFMLGWMVAGALALASKQHLESKIRRILLGVALGGIFQILIVSKQMSYQYMAPMIGITSLILAFLYKVFPAWWRRGLKYLVIVITAVSLGLMALSLKQVNENTQKTKDILNVIARDYAQCWVCPFYRSSLPGFGFVFWNNLINRDDYEAILKKYYPDMVYYDIFANDFKTSPRNVVALWQLKTQKPRILIYGSERDPKSFEPYLIVNKVYSNGGSEALYEVISARSSLGIDYFQFAKILDSQGRHEDAYKAAVESQLLGVGQDLSGLILYLKQKIR